MLRTRRRPDLRRVLPVAAFIVLMAAAPAAAMVASFAPAGTGAAFPDSSNGTLTTTPSLEAHRIENGVIELDGRLDEAVWDLAPTGWGFRQTDPNRFADASVPTVFKVLYDDDAFYFGVACFEDDVANIASYLSRRDNIEASDVVSIYVDPYHDHTTGYNFRVNPAGVQQDAYIFDNGRRDRDWNAVWDAEVHHDANGWYVEVRVPFSQVRFTPGEDMTWGLQVYRWLHGRGEDTGWVNWERDQSGFVSRWGTLTGLRGVHNPRKLEVRPYVLTRHSDPATDEDDEITSFQNMGADFKYGITANLTLNATIQPDYGQVEADPALLNLSPFETWYPEKRPFFIEGARFFQHPEFNLFYSRRIGLEEPNSRIRAAGKLTGRTGGNVTVAALAAATDLAPAGQAHNPFANGIHKAYYGVLRTGLLFDEGNHSVNIMGTAVSRDQDTFQDTQDDFLRRDGYSVGGDAEFHFSDRMYRWQGSAVGTLVEPHDQGIPPEDVLQEKTGYGAVTTFRKLAGVWRGGVGGRMESEDLDPNDMGFMQVNDKTTVFGDIAWIYNSDGDDGVFNRADIHLDGHKSWLYSGNEGYDLTSGDLAWAYEPRHRRASGVHFSASGQLRSFWQGFIYLGHGFEGTSKYATRDFNDERGPLMTTPSRYLVAGGITTDWRRPWSVELEYEYDTNTAGNLEHEAELGLRWNQSEHFTHRISFGYSSDRSNAQWMENFANNGAQTGVDGIGSVDYVFGELDRTTWDLTLRSDILFNRDHSLQIYMQPFLTYGTYSDPRYLATADSYDLRPYDLSTRQYEYAPGEFRPISASDYDFDYGALNLNVVYRWEYRPGSTIFLVWTHAKESYEEGFDQTDPAQANQGFDPGYPFRTEPANTFTAKISYWFSI